MNDARAPDGSPPAELAPLDADVDASVRLGREAILGRPGIGEFGSALADQFESRLRGGAVTGALARRGGQPVGVAVWERRGSLGMAVDLLYLRPADAVPARYRWILEEIARTAGPVAFAPGDLPGIAGPDEERLMAGLGYARFGRSEMQRTAGAPIPPSPTRAPGRVRPYAPSDETAVAALSYRAYHGRFDRYLFLQEDDEEADARHLVQDVFAGRWGEAYLAGSLVSEDGQGVQGAILSVRRPPGVLIASLMVDPARQGEGIGAALLAEAVRAIEAAREAPVVLAVTEGNRRAMRLYERYGFVRTMGPTRDWYSTRRIPVSPDAD